MSFPLFGKNYSATLLNWAPKLTTIRSSLLKTVEEVAFPWTNWTPTYGATAPLTYTGVETRYAKYRKMVNIVHFMVSATGTTGVGPGNILTFTVPIPMANIYFAAFSGIIVDGGAILSATVTAGDTVTMNVRRYDQANLTVGANEAFAFTGFYEIDESV